MIAIIDYGVGNLFSLKSSLTTLGLEAEVTSDRDEISASDRVILPGVGAFGDAAQKLKDSGLFSFLRRIAEEGKPLLGICLGMQLLFERGYEYGEHEGLGLLSGEVRPLAEDVKGLKIPHMGWNALHFVRQNPLFKNTGEGEYVYFVHSYQAKNCDDSLLATSDYGTDVTAAVGKGKVYGTQFHPEKSGEVGLRILKAFSEL